MAITSEEIVRIKVKVDSVNWKNILEKKSEIESVDKILTFYREGIEAYKEGKLELAYNKLYILTTFISALLSQKSKLVVGPKSKSAVDDKYVKSMVAKEFHKSMAILEELEEQASKSKDVSGAIPKKVNGVVPKNYPINNTNNIIKDIPKSYSNNDRIIKPDEKYGKKPVQPSSIRNEITCNELKVILHEPILIIDCRPQDQFRICSIKSEGAYIINIPIEINTPGLSAYTLGDKLNGNFGEIWKRRKAFDKIILLDEFSKVTTTSRITSLERLLFIFKEMDPNTKYKTSPVLLEGGFDAWYCTYPFFTTSPDEYKKYIAKRKPDQQYGTQGIIYPSLDPENISPVKEKQIENIIPIEPPIFDSKSPSEIIPPLNSPNENINTLNIDTIMPNATYPKLNDLVKDTTSSPDKDLNILQPKKNTSSIPLIDRTNKPPGDSNPGFGQDQHFAEKQTPSLKRTDTEKLKYDSNKSNDSFGSKLTRFNSSPDISQLNGDLSYGSEDRTSHIPRYDRSTKPTYGKRTSFDLRDDTIAGVNVKPGLTGLKNLGNSCYINSIVQCLSNTIPLKNHFDENIKEEVKVNRSSKTRGKLADEIGRVFRSLWAGKYKSHRLDKFKIEIGEMKKTFRGYEQQDSHEFLTYLIDSLHEDLKTPCSMIINGASVDSGEKAWGEFKSKNNSIVSDLFYGQLKSTVTCLHCDEKSSTFEVFSNVSLPLPSTDSCALQECLNLYLKDEEIQGWHCPRCNQKRDAKKKLDITRLPPILVIHLKRFTSDGWCRKKQTLVDFPEQCLDMTRYTVSKESRDTRYSLYAISNHYGTMESGHYTAYCKNDSRWFKFDDSDVSEISTSKIKSTAAYILFYATSRISSLS